MSKVTIIAEIGHNHCGDIDMAKDLIYVASNLGADIAKMQLYDIDTIKKPGDTNYEELKRAQLTKEDMHHLNDWAKECEIEFLCSVFSVDRLDWWLETKPKKVKLAQRSYNNLELIEAVKDSGLHVIASKPANYLPSLYEEFNEPDILWCMSRREILQNGIYAKDFPEVFGYMNNGFSDHTIGLEWAKFAIERGATIIEKHFTYSKNYPGWDQPASMTPWELKELRKYADAR